MAMDDINETRSRAQASRYYEQLKDVVDRKDTES